MEETTSKKDHVNFDLFSMKIEQEQRGIEVTLNCKDPTDLVLIAGFVVRAFKVLDAEPTIKVRP